MTSKILTTKGQVLPHKKVGDMFGKLHLANRKAVSIEGMNAVIHSKAKHKRVD